MNPELLLAAGIPMLTFAVGYGMLRARVRAHDEGLKEKASNDRVDGLRDTVELTQATVQRLEAKIDRLMERK